MPHQLLISQNYTNWYSMTSIPKFKLKVYYLYRQYTGNVIHSSKGIAIVAEKLVDVLKGHIYVGFPHSTYYTATHGIIN